MTTRGPGGSAFLAEGDPERLVIVERAAADGFCPGCRTAASVVPGD